MYLICNPAPRGDERFDFEDYGRLVDEVMARVSAALGRPIRLILEPGRLVVAQAGYFVCRVVDVKERAGRLLLGVNASSAQFPRPLFYPEDAYHPVTLLRPDGAVLEGEGVPTDIYGCSTYSRDYLGRDLSLPRPAPGDLVVFEHAGAYCASARSEFLGFPPAGSLLV